jgi:hydroxypyruvate reductase
VKDRLRANFAAVLRELDPTPAVRTALQSRHAELVTVRDVLVLALGKAARPMATAAAAELRAIAPKATVRGLVVVPEPDDRALPPFEVLAGGHPLPTAGSFAAARRALQLCHEASSQTFVLFLISGGASSLCELPLDDSISLASWREFYRALVGSGAGIEAINTVRKFVSATKGGKLAAAAHRAHSQWTLAIGDVPGDDLSALGSGPSLGCDTTLAEFREVLLRHDLLQTVPLPLRARAAIADLPPLLQRDAPCMAHSRAFSLLDNDVAVAAAQLQALGNGFRTVVVRDADELQSHEAAAHLLAVLRDEVAHAAGPVAVIAGGEVRVALPAQVGTGGRNQHFALQCAIAIAEEPITVLSCGTDGIDGNSTAAGALVDGTTIARARARGLDVDAALRTFDAFPLLHALGDTVITGPTGTNVRDVRILVHSGAAAKA